MQKTHITHVIPEAVLHSPLISRKQLYSSYGRRRSSLRLTSPRTVGRKLVLFIEENYTDNTGRRGILSRDNEAPADAFERHSQKGVSGPK